MNRFFTILILFSSLFISAIYLNAEESKKNDQITLSLSQDPVFGFYPALNGNLELNSTTSFTFYGVLWTSPTTGNPKYIGADLMTEVGIGLSFSLMDNSLIVKPSIGVGNGLYQSNANRPLFADNIVPALALEYSTGNLSMNLNTIYWKSFRNHGYNTVDMFEYSFNSDYPIFRNFSMGLFLDHLITTEHSETTIRSYTTYFWVGPSFKIQVRNATMWFASGMDFTDYFADNIISEDRILKEFYKLSFSFSF